jgi:hypothetical protein
VGTPHSTSNDAGALEDITNTITAGWIAVNEYAYVDDDLVAVFRWK